MAYNVSGLTDYVESKRLPLIEKLGLEAPSVAMFEKMLNVKYKENLNLIDVNAPLTNADSCGFSANGNVDYTAREMEVFPMKVNIELCEKDLRKKWMNYQLNTNATDDKIPFEEYVMNGVIKSVNDQVETLVWQGDTTISGTTYLNLMDGFIKMMENDSDVVDVTFTSAMTAYDKVLAVYNAIPDKCLKDAEIYVDWATFRSLVLELSAKNLYHYDPTINPSMQIILPATNTRVKAIAGLNGTGAVVAGIPSRMFVGLDLEGDRTLIDSWYSKDNGTNRIAIEFVLGVQYPYGSELVLGE